MNFKMKIKYEDRVIVDAKGNDIKDFDPIIKGLKEKFDGQNKKRNK